MINFTIPGEPTAKQRPKHGNGFTYTPTKTVNYETLVKEIFATQFPLHMLFEGPLKLMIILAIIAAFIILIMATANTETVTDAPTPKPTSNIESRLQQIELQLAQDKEKHEELQRGIDRVETQYKSWVKPFENLFSASQKEYIERYHKKYAEVG